MSAPPFLDADAIRAAVPIAEMIDAVGAAYRDVAAGRDRSPLRSHVALEKGDLLLMPGVRSGASGASVKLVTVMPGNAAHGRPTVQAIVAWFGATTGEPLALLDGPMLTAMRTGAASGVATRLLAREDAATLAVIGAGAQAEWQVRAVLAVRPIKRILVCSRSAESRDRFAQRIGQSVPAEVLAVPDVEAAVRDGDVVCCATTSSEPVFDASWLRPGAHVNGIGAFRLGMVELPPELFAAASVVAVDARAAAMAEAGDLVAAIERGLLSEADLVEIGSVEAGRASSRDPEAITAFKSVGLAIQDVAAAELIVDRLLGPQLGQPPE